MSAHLHKVLQEKEKKIAELYGKLKEYDVCLDQAESSFRAKLQKKSEVSLQTPRSDAMKCKLAFISRSPVCHNQSLGVLSNYFHSPLSFGLADRSSQVLLSQ